MPQRRSHTSSRSLQNKKRSRDARNEKGTNGTNKELFKNHSFSPIQITQSTQTDTSYRIPEHESGHVLCRCHEKTLPTGKPVRDGRRSNGEMKTKGGNNNSLNNQKTKGPNQGTQKGHTERVGQQWQDQIKEKQEGKPPLRNPVHVKWTTRPKTRQNQERGRSAMAERERWRAAMKF